MFNSTDQEGVNRAIWRLALPNLVTNITVPLLGVADLAMMGHLDNVALVGAIALGSTIFSVLYSVMGFLRMGTSGMAAQAYGASDPVNISLVLQRSLLLAMVIAMAMIVLQEPIQWLSFQFLQGNMEVQHMALAYFRIRIWAAPATLGLYAWYGWFLGMQNARIPMILAILVNVVNIGLNLIFVFGLHMNVEGVAWATLAAQYVGFGGAIFYYMFFFRKLVRWQPLGDVVKWKALRRFFTVNSNIFIRSIVLLLTLTFFTAMSARAGETILAVNTLLFQFFFLFSYFADGIAYAAEALVGKAQGARNKNGIHMLIVNLFRWGLASALLVGVVYAVATEPILRIMTDNDNLIMTALTYRWWVVLLPITSVAAFLWDGIYIGVTATRVMRNVMLVASFVAFFPVYYLTRNLFDNHALWLALNAFLLARSLLMWYHWPADSD